LPALFRLNVALALPILVHANLEHPLGYLYFLGLLGLLVGHVRGDPATASGPTKTPADAMRFVSRRLCGRRVEKNIKSRDLAVARDVEIHTSVRRRFAFRPRAPRQASRIVQNLGCAMRRINEMRMRRSKIAGELVQCVVTDERAGRRV